MSTDWFQKLKLRSVYMIMILWILFTAEPNYMLWLYFPSSFFFFEFLIAFFLILSVFAAVMILPNQRYLFIITTPRRSIDPFFFGANYPFFLIWADYTLGWLRRCHFASSYSCYFPWLESQFFDCIPFVFLVYILKLLEHVLR